MTVTKKNDSIVAVVGTHIEVEEIVKDRQKQDGSMSRCAAAGHLGPRCKRQAYQGFPV